MSHVLDVHQVRSGYASTRVLHGVSLSVEHGTVAAVLGPNGAGKSTLLRTIAGSVPVTAGQVVLDGQDITRLGAAAVAARGLSHSPEGRGMFPRLTTRQNLVLGGYLRNDRAGLEQDVDEFLAHWPVIGRRANSPAGQLSGGEQQLVALGRAMMARPKLALLDEPSLGLAPVMVKQLYRAVKEYADRRQSIVLVEQNVTEALAVADTVHVLVGGSIVHAGPADDVTPRDVADMYFRHGSATKVG